MIFPTASSEEMLITMCRNTYLALHGFFTPVRSGHSDSFGSCCNYYRRGKEEKF